LVGESLRRANGAKDLLLVETLELYFVGRLNGREVKKLEGGCLE
jgi:hypothetical protein